MNIFALYSIKVTVLTGREGSSIQALPKPIFPLLYGDPRREVALFFQFSEDAADLIREAIGVDRTKRLRKLSINTPRVTGGCDSYDDISSS